GGESVAAKVRVGKDIANDTNTFCRRMDMGAGGGDQAPAVEGAVVDAFLDLAPRVPDAFALHRIEPVEVGSVGRRQAANIAKALGLPEGLAVESHAQHGLGPPEVIGGKSGVDLLRLAGQERGAGAGMEGEKGLKKARVAKELGSCSRAASSVKEVSAAAVL